MAYQMPMLTRDGVVSCPEHLRWLTAVLERCESIVESLGALFTLGQEESIAEVRVAGRVVFSGAGV